ncbi:glycoside hydrolase family 5 protein [Sinomicrobium pectinilyticum]|uniref:Glycoside hydrolase family 5 protein n=1 Tax=Sinomicrobium pectinilyticum TaxID=1084421 RepID=A0A3N0EHE2_SINP1|nr:cellulase family glycosylhydrolase [Sinomicrobium pectinilyticum]RNL87204.1 glycoside hydrolase family 5 protein [Sinomicrobium pectinilyticum]
MKYKFRLFALVVLLTSCSCSQDERIVFVDGEQPLEQPVDSAFPTAQEIILDMKAGFNLGNTFDNGINATSFSGIKPIVDLYTNAGMKHMRIPTTWMDRFEDHLADSEGNININHPRFLELVQVIDYAIERDIYVILNTHHEHWLKDHYDGSAGFDNKFRNLWSGIATYFREYPVNLVFEVLNEPEGNLGENDGSGPFPDPTDPTALEYTRKINKIGYDAIRATGGNNTTRIIMVGTNGQGNALYIDEVYPNKSSLPGEGADPYLAIQVHSYSPWSFCGETGSNAAFPGSSFFETGIQEVSVHSTLLGVPVNYGEFGVGRSSNTGERNTDLVRGYYKTMADAILGQSMSYCVWDDRGWFGLVNNSGTEFTYGIVPFMLQ